MNLYLLSIENCDSKGLSTNWLERNPKFLTLFWAMDIIWCSALALGAIYLSHSVYNWFTDSILQAFLALFALQYTVVKIYRIFVVPHFLSVLRHIPGPDVSHYQSSRRTILILPGWKFFHWSSLHTVPITTSSATALVDAHISRWAINPIPFFCKHGSDYVE